MGVPPCFASRSRKVGNIFRSAGAIVAMLAGRKVAARLAGPRLQQGFALLSAAVALLLLARAAGAIAM